MGATDYLYVTWLNLGILPTAHLPKLRLAPAAPSLSQ